MWQYPTAAFCKLIDALVVSDVTGLSSAEFEPAVVNCGPFYKHGLTLIPTMDKSL